MHVEEISELIDQNLEDFDTPFCLLRSKLTYFVRKQLAEVLHELIHEIIPSSVISTETIRTLIPIFLCRLEAEMNHPNGLSHDDVILSEGRKDRLAAFKQKIAKSIEPLLNSEMKKDAKNQQRSENKSKARKLQFEWITDLTTIPLTQDLNEAPAKFLDFCNNQQQEPSSGSTEAFVYKTFLLENTLFKHLSLEDLGTKDENGNKLFLKRKNEGLQQKSLEMTAEAFKFICLNLVNDNNISLEHLLKLQAILKTFRAYRESGCLVTATNQKADALRREALLKFNRANPFQQAEIKTLYEQKMVQLESEYEANNNLLLSTERVLSQMLTFGKDLYINSRVQTKTKSLNAAIDLKKWLCGILLHDSDSPLPDSFMLLFIKLLQLPSRPEGTEDEAVQYVANVTTGIRNARALLAGTTAKKLEREDYLEGIRLIRLIQSNLKKHGALLALGLYDAEPHLLSSFSIEERKREQFKLDRQLYEAQNQQILLFDPNERKRIFQLIAHLRQEGIELAKEPETKLKGDVLIQLADRMRVRSEQHYDIPKFASQRELPTRLLRQQQQFKNDLMSQLNETFQEEHVRHFRPGWKKMWVGLSNALLLAFAIPTFGFTLGITRYTTGSWFLKAKTHTQTIVQDHATELEQSFTPPLR